jgi:hypothetical protein
MYILILNDKEERVILKTKTRSRRRSEVVAEVEEVEVGGGGQILKQPRPQDREENTHVIEPYDKCKRVCRHNLERGREALQYKTRERINAEKARLLEEKKRTRRSVSSRRRCLYRRKLKKERL